MVGRNSGDIELLDLLIEEKNVLLQSLEGNISTTSFPSSTETFTNTIPVVTSSLPPTSTSSNSTFFSISLPEIVQDVTKWVAYDLLLPADVPDHVPVFTAIKVF